MPSPGEISVIYRARAQGLIPALRRGVGRALVAVERLAQKYTSGSGSSEAGAYPVPIRAGNLSRSFSVRRLGDTSGLVLNRATYARAIHGGFTPYGNPRLQRMAGRPFLDDAVEDADPSQYVLAALRPVILG